jgi:hypothetical protein
VVCILCTFFMNYTKCMGFTSPSKGSHFVIPSNDDTVLVLLVEDTGIGQNNGNTTDTVHISSIIWCLTNFCLQYYRNPSWNGLVPIFDSLYQNCIPFLLKYILKLLYQCRSWESVPRSSLQN